MTGTWCALDLDIEKHPEIAFHNVWTGVTNVASGRGQGHVSFGVHCKNYRRPAAVLFSECPGLLHMYLCVLHSRVSGDPVFHWKSQGPLCMSWLTYCYLCFPICITCPLWLVIISTLSEILSSRTGLLPLRPHCINRCSFWQKQNTVMHDTNQRRRNCRMHMFLFYTRWWIRLHSVFHSSLFSLFFPNAYM